MEQTQPKLSKYAAKQLRLETDPDFGTDYSDKIKDQIAAGIEAATTRRLAVDAAKEAARVDVDVEKITAKIVAITSEIALAEAKLTRYAATIKATEANMNKQKANIERLSAQLVAHRAKLQPRETIAQ